MTANAFSFSPQEQSDTFDDRLLGTQMIDASQTPQTSYHTLSDRTLRRMPGESPAAHGQTQTESDKLRFCLLHEWDELISYEEDVPTYLHYSIEWKVTVNNKVVSRDTEPDVVLVPLAYWHMVLKPKLDKLLCKKLAQNRPVRCDDTNVTVSVSDRTERDLIKRFEDLDIDWPVIAKKLESWGERFRSGKKLRVELCFNYIDSYAPSASTAARRGDKRESSATQRMLADRASQLDAEQESTGGASIWREVYTLMRCPGPPCDLGPHCWRDPVGKKHYRLRTHHLKALINAVEEGLILKGHEDIPEEIREQLFAEERQRLDRQPRSTSTASTPYPPINITNVLPQSHQSPSASSIESAPVVTTRPSSNACLDIPGPRDLAVKVYGEWQQSNVVDEKLKEEFRKACDVTLQDGLDLEQVHEDQDPGFFIKSGIKRGVARRFISDIERWAKRYKVSCDGDGAVMI